MPSPQIDTDPIVSILNHIQQRGHSAYTIFEDWVELILLALQRQDDPYLDIVDDYSEPRDMDHPEGERTVELFANAFGQLQKQMSETNADVLGAVYEEYGMSSDNFGQHFTPHNVCEAMVEITHTVDDQPRDGGEKQVVTDPACGSGRMLLCAGRRLPEAVFVGQDKDPLCAKMTALNLCFFNLDGYTILGDSLTLEYRRVWQTNYSPLGGAVRELNDEQVQTLRENLAPEADTNTSNDDVGVADSVGTPSIPDDTAAEQQSLTVFQTEDI